MPEVSIILPNYNHEAYLRQRLDSIFNQTFQDFELILLDDASTDASMEILSEYAMNSKVSYFEVNKANSGSPFKQWKKGIRLAQGKFVWIAESDDWADVRFLETLIPKFKDDNIGIVHCGMHWIDENGNPIPDKTYHKQTFRRNGIAEIKQHMLSCNSIQNVSAVLFRKEVFNELNLSNYTSYRQSGDWLMYISILSKWDIYFTSQKLSYFRRHSESASINGWRNGSWTIEGSDIFLIFDIRKYLKFSEYKPIIQYWLNRICSLRKNAADLVLRKMLFKMPLYLKWYFIFYFYRLRISRFAHKFWIF
jgi:glycosyltransferase involved in cell wall biosynthesis